MKLDKKVVINLIGPEKLKKLQAYSSLLREGKKLIAYLEINGTENFQKDFFLFSKELIKVQKKLIKLKNNVAKNGKNKLVLTEKLILLYKNLRQLKKCFTTVNHLSSK